MADPESSQITQISAGPPIPPGPAARDPQSEGVPDDATVVTNREPFAEGSAGSRPPLEIGKMLEGERLGQFILQEFVGGGGMGVVFRALDTTLNRDVAVKVLSRDQSRDEETLRRFKNEAQSAARLDHENIARVHYVGEDRGLHYIVFEFIEGTNLRDLVEQKGPLPLVEAVSYTLQVAEALTHASRRDVIHRDIKPSNVLITPDGKAKLVDMGLARLHQVEHPSNDLTASGVTLGTFDYISPEQARDPRSADVRSDLYSLGCSFFYMLTGRPPFAQGTVLQKLLQHQGDAPPDPRDFRPDLPPEASRILGKMLAKDPQRRYQKPDELIGELLVLGERVGLPASAVGVTWTAPVVQPPSALRRHLSWIVPLVVLLVSILILDYYWSSSDSTASWPTFGHPTSGSGTTTRSPHTPATGNGTAPPADAKAQGTPGAPASPAQSSAAPEAAPMRRQSVPPPSTTTAVAPLRSASTATAGPAHAAARPGGTPLANLPPSPSNLPAPRRAALLVVGEPGGQGTVYPSLEAAYSSAHSGDVIELRYNGRRDERPLVLENLNLTIRAGDGFQPVLNFRPTERDALKYPHSMLTVTGGQLRLLSVHLELEIPHSVPSDGWALIETRRAELVRLERCTLTIHNAGVALDSYHPAVAFFDLKAPPGSDTMGMGRRAGDPRQIDGQPVVLELEHCIARGQATFLRNSDLQPVKLTWDNGLLVTSERLLRAHGSAIYPRYGGRMQLDLRHLTAVMRSGMALLTNEEDTPYQLPVELRSSDSILLVSSGMPLVEQRGADHVAQYRERLQWTAERNFYEGVKVFWRVVGEAIGAEGVDFTFAEWRSYWPQQHESLPNRDAVVWKEHPAAELALDAHTPEEYALSTTATSNPALGGASDGSDAGCQAQLLPRLPPQP